MVGIGAARSSSVLHDGSRKRARGAGRSPGFDLLDTLASPGGSTAVVREIPRVTGLSVSDQTPAPS